MSMYGQFKTDADLEAKGIVLDYGTFKVTVARAGGNNKRYAKTLEAKTRPFKRAMQTETLSNEKSLDILFDVYAEAIVLNWETLYKGEWKVGIEGENGELLPFNKENVLKTFRALPDLFANIQEDATKISLFKAELQKNDTGN